MKTVNTKKECQVCHRQFLLKELYPNSLIRNSVLQAAKKIYPELSPEGFVCFPDLRTVSAIHSEEILMREKGVLTELEKDVIQSLKEQDVLSENINTEFDEAETLGQKLSDKIARFGGSWMFISLFVFVIFCWMAINTLGVIKIFDPFPFIFLNLFLSCRAALQAPIIMMSQNRQAAKDRLQLEHDYRVNLKAELQIRQLNARMEIFMKHQWQKMYELLRLQDEIIQDMRSK